MEMVAHIQDRLVQVIQAPHLAVHATIQTLVMDMVDTLLFHVDLVTIILALGLIVLFVLNMELPTTTVLTATIQFVM
jgi:hypothetical protein